jgi:hypothetical protein
MKRYSGFSMVAVAALLLQGCLGSGGSSAPAPNNVKVVAKDSRVIVAWDMVGGVQYWLWSAVGAGITPQTCSSMSLCTTSFGVVSPTTFLGLSNGTTYSFTINGRKDGGPGGPGSAAVEATPKLAGATWTTGTTTSASTLRGVAYGAMYVAVGDNGALYSGTAYTIPDATLGVKTGITWSALTNPLATNFNAVNYDSYRAKYLSVGADGNIIAMTPSSSSTWSTQTSNTTDVLNAIANNGAGTTVVTGAGGRIIYSTDGATWTPLVSGSNALNGVTYGYSTASSTSYFFVAVGASGTVLHSEDGIAWAPATSGVGVNLTGVTYGNGVFIAVGASGTVLTSPDGVTWTQQTSIPSANLNAVTYSSGRRFIAVANEGSIFYSEYGAAGVSWTQATVSPPTASPLYAVTPGGLYDYSAVGTSGLNLYAD